MSGERPPSAADAPASPAPAGASAAPADAVPAAALPAGAVPAAPGEPWPAVLAPYPGWTPPPPPPPPVNWRDVAVALVAGLVVAALGVPLALLWSTIGPHVRLVKVADGATLDDFNTEAFVGADGTFGAIAIGAGILVGGSCWALRRWRGPAMLVGIALGGVAGAWTTWKLGQRIGLSDYRDLLANAEPGTRFEQPVKLRAHGLIFLQSTVAVIVYVVNAAWSHRADLGTERGRPTQPPAGYPAPPGATDQRISSAPSEPAAPPAAPGPPAAGSTWSPPA